MSSKEKKCYFGRCHCGSVKFKITTDLPELTTCDCSMCRRRNALMVKVHKDDFELIEGSESLTQYQFHTNTAKHFFCKTCGIYPFHRKRAAPDYYGINFACLEGADIEGVPIRATDGIGMS